MCIVSGWAHLASGSHQILGHLSSTRSAHLLLWLSVQLLRIVWVFAGLLGCLSGCQLEFEGFFCLNLETSSLFVSSLFSSAEISA